MERFDTYDPFAGIYNRHWGYFAEKIYPILDRIWSCGISRRAAPFSIFAAVPDSLPLCLPIRDSPPRAWTDPRG